ncbi:hypothetical protein AHAS_Ahas15G0204200 [Arachis hypogaea]
MVPRCTAENDDVEGCKGNICPGVGEKDEEDSAEAREKLIVSMLEDIRVYLLNRWVDNRQSVITYAGEILQKINKKFEREFDKGGEWLAIYAGRDKYKPNTAPQAKKSAGTTRTPNPSKNVAKTITKVATKPPPKKKSNTQVVGTQQSQTSSKKAICSSNASQPQPSTTIVTSPSRRTLKYMAKTSPRI